MEGREAGVFTRFRARRVEGLAVALGMFDRDAAQASQFDDFPRTSTLRSNLNLSQLRMKSGVSHSTLAVFALAGEKIPARLHRRDRKLFHGPFKNPAKFNKIASQRETRWRESQVR